MENIIEKKLRDEWSFYKVEGDELLQNWLEGLPSWTRATNEEIVNFFNYKLMHGPKDIKFLAMAGYKEVEKFLWDYIRSNDQRDIFYMDAILGLSVFGEEAAFEFIEKSLESDLEHRFSSNNYVLYWLKKLDIKRAKDIVIKYKEKKKD